VNVSMIPSDLDPQVMRKLDGRAALARERLDRAEAAVSANGAAYLRAFDAWSAASDKLIAAEDKGRATLAQREKVRRLGAALDVAFDGAISSTRARLGAQRQVEELENPALVAQLARAEEEKRERLAALRAERERRDADDASSNGSAVTRIVDEPRRDYPQVVDNGDGLAQMDRESLRAIAREHGQSVAGHKAVLIERLRKAGVTP
jgi:hypothetical protein